MAYGGNIVEPASSSEIVLRSLSQKTAVGSTLTGAEVLMGMSAAVLQNGSKFGPSPAEMTVPAAEMPESLKGALASAKI